MDGSLFFSEIKHMFFLFKVICEAIAHLGTQAIINIWPIFRCEFPITQMPGPFDMYNIPHYLIIKIFHIDLGTAICNLKI